MRQQQHGDVLILEVTRLPKGAKLISPRDGKLILAEGEATGHAHAIVDTDCDVDVYRIGNVTFLHVRQPVEVVHEEHSTVTLPPAVWRVSQVREYDHFREESRRVMD